MRLLKQKSLVNKILFIIVFTVVLACLLITAVGTQLIYKTTKSGIEKEVVQAGGTLKNLFEKEYPGDFTCDGYIYRFGEMGVIAEDFYKVVSYINSSEDMEFTVFYDDMRVFTTIVNESGSSAVGTYAADNVVADVIKNGETKVYSGIDINGVEYIGYYMPIVNSSNEIRGMYFAGKPVKLAISNAKSAIVGFIIVALITLGVSVALCIFITERMVRDLVNIKRYIGMVARGDFSVKMDRKTLERDDEIGDISRDAETLSTNLSDMIERDPLTSLYNRRTCNLKIKELINNKVSYAVVMGDIDYFKKINDTYGHACGDYILKEISSILSKYALESSSFVSRWGGEEFLIVMPFHNIEKAKLIMNAVLDEIRNSKFIFDDKEIKVTMTFGISEFIEGDNEESPIKRADGLLYEGKQSGRNKIVE